MRQPAHDHADTHHTFLCTPAVALQLTSALAPALALPDDALLQRSLAHSSLCRPSRCPHSPEHPPTACDCLPLPGLTAAPERCPALSVRARLAAADRAAAFNASDCCTCCAVNSLMKLIRRDAIGNRQVELREDATSAAAMLRLPSVACTAVADLRLLCPTVLCRATPSRTEFVSLWYDWVDAKLQRAAKHQSIEVACNC